MAKGTVEIVIAAEDEASAKLRAVAKQTDATVKHIKEAGGQAKASTELIGTLASTLGGSELAGAAGQVAQLTERMSAFSEVMKTGGIGAKAFAAGTVAIAATVGFQVGNALGNVIFQTEKWNNELDRTLEKIKKAASEAARLGEARFAEDMQQIELIADPDKQRAEMESLLGTLDRDIQGVAARVKNNTDEVIHRTETWAGWFGRINKDYAGYAKELEASVESDEAILEAKKAQANELRRMLAIDQEAEAARQQAIKDEEERAQAIQKSADYIAAMKLEVAALTATEAERRDIELQRAGIADGQRDEAMRLLEQRDAIQAKIEKEKELAQIEAQANRDREAAEAKAKADAESRQKTQLGIVQQLKLQAVEMTKGKQAAEQLRFQMQGFSADQAKALAAASQVLQPGGKQGPAPALQATEGRLLTRGPQDDPIAKNTQKLVGLGEKQNKSLDEAVKKLNSVAEAIRNQKTIDLQAVGT